MSGLVVFAEFAGVVGLESPGELVVFEGLEAVADVDAVAGAAVVAGSADVAVFAGLEEVADVTDVAGVAEVRLG